jgi:DNA polymerase elongation subunit (family B)
MNTQFTSTIQYPTSKSQAGSAKKVIAGKTYRLLDFNVYDRTDEDDATTTSSSGTDDTDGENNTRKYTSRESTYFVIQMFGVDEKGNTCCIFVNNYRPFFFAKVDDTWTQAKLDLFMRVISGRREMHGYYSSIEKAILVDYHKLYGFSGGKKHKFIQFVFKNVATMNRMKNLWYESANTGTSGMETTGDQPAPKYSSRKLKPFYFQGTSIEIYESSIPPLLRYFHIQNISPSGWVWIPVSNVIIPPKRTTTCTYEYICRVSQIVPRPEKETRVPYKICSFDIEASSSHGDFPLPVKTYKRLASNVVDVFTIHMSNIDITRAESLLRRLILTAFGYDHFNDIDRVYPKRHPTKPQVMSRIDQIVKTRIADSTKLIDTEEGDKTHLLKIDEVFRNIIQTIGGDAGDDHDKPNTNDDSDNEDAEPAVGAYRSYKPTQRAREGQVDTENTIIHVLISPKYTRDEKIQYTNDMLTRVFPQLEGDKTTFIGSTFLRYGEKEPYLNHCVVLGSCDEIAGAVIESVNSERDLLLRWARLIQQENPDIIIGYNIFGFDYEFLFRRAQEIGCVDDFMQLSRKIGESSAKEQSDGNLAIEHTTVQLASGEYDLRYFKMTGRIQIDMYTYFRRDFNLSSYKLDDVAGQFISDDIKKVELWTDSDTGAQTTALHSVNLSGLHIGDFVHIELSGFTSDYYKNGCKFRVTNIVYDYETGETDKKGNPVKTNVIVIDGHEDALVSAKNVKWGMAKDDVSPQDIFRLSGGSSADRAIVAKYCIQDCNLVHHLMNKIDVLTGYVEMSSICSVPISFLVFRGQGIKLTSYVAKKCREKNTLMPDLEKSGENDGYEGAIVLPPKCSMYMDNPVACVDYSSLYPSSMISQNLSHDSKVWTREYDLSGKLLRETGEKDAAGNYKYDNMPGYEYIDMEFDTYRYMRKTPTSRAEKVKSGTKVCRWAQFPENRKGIMPSILEELLKARSDTRKKIKTENDPFMQNILDKRQLGYKVTANSLYGQCGAKTSTFYEKDVAASTTATGRMMIMYAKRIIEEVYGDMEYVTESHGPVLTRAEYVYGDSVAAYTPVYVRVDNKYVDICTIDQLATRYGGGLWRRCTEIGKQEKEVCELNNIETWTEKGWTKLHRVIRHALAQTKRMLRVITSNGLVDVTDDHSLLRSNGEEISPANLSLGETLLHCPLTNEDGRQISRKTPMSNILFTKNGNPITQVDAAVYLWKLRTRSWFGQTYRVGETATGEYMITPDSLFTTPAHKRAKNAITSIREISYNGYVYDLTTDNHHFAAGIGDMIVHNTDSVFFTFNLMDSKTGEKIRGQKALEMTIEIAQDAAHLCTQWLKPPMELSYEKTLMPFILLSKKRYVGMLYETDATKGKLKYMGLSLKRRDSCDYLKDTYGGILNILMGKTITDPSKPAIQNSIDFLDKSLRDLAEGRVPMDKLMITKALRSDYKNPDQIAHKVLSERIGKRDPGNKPKPGDRIKFVFVVNDQPKALQGEKIETPEYIQSAKLRVDYAHYITNQLMKPLQQLFGLAVVQIWETQGKLGAVNTYNRELKKIANDCSGDIEAYMKQKEKLSSKKVKILLFDNVLTQIYQKKQGFQSITGFFGNKPT